MATHIFMNQEQYQTHKQTMQFQKYPGTELKD
jgi:hypothetical protein